MKRIVHNEHKTAGSLRQQGMPLLYLSADGKIVGMNERGTRKRASYIWVPDEVAFIAHCYWSNSGKRRVYYYNTEFETVALGVEPDPILIDWEYGEPLPDSIPVYDDSGNRVEVRK